MAGEYFSLIVNLAIYIDISNIIVSINEVDPQTVKKTRIFEFSFSLVHQQLLIFIKALHQPQKKKNTCFLPLSEIIKYNALIYI